MEREEIQTQLSQSEQSARSDHNDRPIRSAISSSERPEVNKASIVKVASWYRPIHGATSDTKDSKSVDYHDILSKTVSHTWALCRGFSTLFNYRSSCSQKL